MVDWDTGIHHTSSDLGLRIDARPPSVSRHRFQRPELAVIFGAVTVCSSLADAVRVSALTSATPLAAECYWPLAAVAVK